MVAAILIEAVECQALDKELIENLKEYINLYKTFQMIRANK